MRGSWREVLLDLPILEHTRDWLRSTNCNLDQQRLGLDKAFARSGPFLLMWEWTLGTDSDDASAARSVAPDGIWRPYDYCWQGSCVSRQ